MPEHRAQTHVQRALHSLLLDDEQSAAVYLLRALSSLRQTPNHCKVRCTTTPAYS